MVKRSKQKINRIQYVRRNIPYTIQFQASKVWYFTNQQIIQITKGRYELQQGEVQICFNVIIFAGALVDNTFSEFTFSTAIHIINVPIPIIQTFIFIA